MKRAGDVLAELLRRARIQLDNPHSSIVTSWPRIVGEDLASHAHLADVDRGRMMVEVDHPAWLQLLQMQERRIVREVARRYPQLEVTRMTSVLRRTDPRSK